jgi:molybdate transport system substrate-binding protein
MKTHSLRSHFFLLLLFFSQHLSAADVPVIAVAASLKFAVKDIAEAFHQDTGKTVRVSYSSSGNLTRQIQQGGPFELFLSANSKYVEQLYQQHKTLDQGITYALGRVVLLTSKNTSISLDDQLSGIKQAFQNNQLKHFAIANPVHAPYGTAAREVLQHQGLWTLIQSRLVFGENVAQATQFASSGAAQVGLVSYSLALAATLQNTTYSVLIPANWHQPLKQTAVLLKGAGETAKSFYSYLQQDKASLILAGYGYTKP